MKILFINPSPMPFADQKEFFQHGNTSRVPDFGVPLGMIEISSFLRSRVQGVDINFLDIAKELHVLYQEIVHDESFKNPFKSCAEFYGSHINSIALTPDVIGLSVLFSTSYFSALEIARLVKEKWPNSLLICGGNHSTAYYRQVLEHPQIDLVFRGEAELSLKEFVDVYRETTEGRLRQTSSTYTHIHGVYDREKASRISTEPLERAEFIQDLDELGMPAFDLVDMNFYRDASSLWDGGSVMWSRGCPFHCTFCASHVVHGRKVREKSNDRIIEELQHLRRLGFKTLSIYDDLLAARKKKFLSLVDSMEAAGLVGSMEFRLPNSLSVAILDEEIIDAIERMGVQYFRVSIESGSEFTQKNIIKKNVDLEKARRVLKYMRTKPLPLEACFVLGFPGETKELMQETVDFIGSIDVDWVLITSALPFPGSEMFFQFVEGGFIDEDSFNWDMNRMPLRDFDTPEIGNKELSQLVYDTNIYSNFFHNPNVQHGRYERAIDYFNMMVCGRYPFHVVGFYCRGQAYQMMGDKAQAERDFLTCVEQIRNNVQARRMYQRYAANMALLLPFLDEKEDFLAGVDYPESITVLPTASGL